MGLIKKDRKLMLFDREFNNSEELLNNSNMPKVNIVSSGDTDFFAYFCNIKRTLLGYTFFVTEDAIFENNFEGEKAIKREMFVTNKQKAICYAMGYIFYSLGYSYKDKITIYDINTMASGEKNSYVRFSVKINEKISYITLECFSPGGMKGYITGEKVGRRIIEETDDTITSYDLDEDERYVLSGKHDEENDFAFKDIKKGNGILLESYRDGKLVRLDITSNIPSELEFVLQRNEMLKSLLDGYTNGTVSSNQIVEYVTDEIYAKINEQKKNDFLDIPTFIRLIISPKAIVVPEGTEVYSVILIKRVIVDYDITVRVNGEVIEERPDRGLTEGIVLHKNMNL